MGALLTGMLATEKVNPGISGILARGGLWIEQLKSIGFTIVLAVVGTAVIAFIVRAAVGLRHSPEVERQGLDINDHGEEGYIL
jgi:Amt family ammonium transporter